MQNVKLPNLREGVQNYHEIFKFGGISNSEISDREKVLYHWPHYLLNRFNNAFYMFVLSSYIFMPFICSIPLSFLTFSITGNRTSDGTNEICLLNHPILPVHIAVVLETHTKVRSANIKSHYCQRLNRHFLNSSRF